MVTTRLSVLASELSTSVGHKMNFLDKDTSWDLFRENVFRGENCPLELEEIGRKIVKNCKGLPLSIVVIGGILVKTDQTKEHWEHIAENLNSIVNLEDDEHCLKILYTSYNILPVHLKPCFLYMGIFPEDSEIRVSRLVKLLVAEAFLKPIVGKSLEEVAEEYVKQLIDRNLILVHELKSNGMVKYCKIHDLVRDLCLREAEKQKFIWMQSFNVPRDINSERRICFHKSTSDEIYRVIPDSGYASLTHSLIGQFKEHLPSLRFRLLRICSKVYDARSFIHFHFDGYTTQIEYSLESSFHQVNLQYLYIQANSAPSSGFPSSISSLWNLQTLIVRTKANKVIAPSEIWKMTRLRHVDISSVEIPDPLGGHADIEPRDDHIVLENLQTLLFVRNFKCSEEVVKRIPNIKKLKIYYDKLEEGSPDPIYCLNNLVHLHKLESLRCEFYPIHTQSHLVENLIFPHSLTKLTLYGTQFHWEDMTTKIGSLPLLEVLKLIGNSCIGTHWETVEGQFCSLKFLLIDDCRDLEYWTMTDSTHFPRLERLLLRYLDKLKEIPSCIGDMPTLQSIHLLGCCDSAGDSAQRILEEQEEFGNVDLKVQVSQVRK